MLITPTSHTGWLLLDLTFCPSTQPPFMRLRGAGGVSYREEKASQEHGEIFSWTAISRKISLSSFLTFCLIICTKQSKSGKKKKRLFSLPPLSSTKCFLTAKAGFPNRNYRGHQRSQSAWMCPALAESFPDLTTLDPPPTALAAGRIMTIHFINTETEA